jgi:type VI secretion system protein ImpF
MARSDQDIIVTPSVLDRLIDREPRQSEDSHATRAQSVRHLKAALRRDLEWLLNTRRNPEAAPESMEEVSKSLYNYGLPDFTALAISTPRDQNRLTLEIENAVALFEPRLKDIRVTIVEEPGESKKTRVMHFQIEGMLQLDPAPEQVSFDTVLQLTSGEYQIRGDRGA